MGNVLGRPCGGKGRLNALSSGALCPLILLVQGCRAALVPSTWPPVHPSRATPVAEVLSQHLRLHVGAPQLAHQPAEPHCGVAGRPQANMRMWVEGEVTTPHDSAREAITKHDGLNMRMWVESWFTTPRANHETRSGHTLWFRGVRLDAATTRGHNTSQHRFVASHRFIFTGALGRRGGHRRRRLGPHARLRLRHGRRGALRRRRRRRRQSSWHGGQGQCTRGQGRPGQGACGPQTAAQRV